MSGLSETLWVYVYTLARRGALTASQAIQTPVTPPEGKGEIEEKGIKK